MKPFLACLLVGIWADDLYAQTADLDQPEWTLRLTAVALEPLRVSEDLDTPPLIGDFDRDSMVFEKHHIGG